MLGCSFALAAEIIKNLGNIMSNSNQVHIYCFGLISGACLSAVSQSGFTCFFLFAQGDAYAATCRRSQAPDVAARRPGIASAMHTLADTHAANRLCYNNVQIEFTHLPWPFGLRVSTAPFFAGRRSFCASLFLSLRLLLICGHLDYDQ